MLVQFSLHALIVKVHMFLYIIEQIPEGCKLYNSSRQTLLKLLILENWNMCVEDFLQM